MLKDGELIGLLVYYFFSVRLFDFTNFICVHTGATEWEWWNQLRIERSNYYLLIKSLHLSVLFVLFMISYYVFYKFCRLTSRGMLVAPLFRVLAIIIITTIVDLPVHTLPMSVFERMLLPSSSRERRRLLFLLHRIHLYSSICSTIRFVCRNLYMIKLLPHDSLIVL